MLNARPTVKIWDYGTVVPRPTIMTRYRWALELDVAISAIWLSTALNSNFLDSKKTDAQPKSISFSLSLDLTINISS